MHLHVLPCPRALLPGPVVLRIVKEHFAWWLCREETKQARRLPHPLCEKRGVSLYIWLGTHQSTACNSHVQLGATDIGSDPLKCIPTATLLLSTSAEAAGDLLPTLRAAPRPENKEKHKCRWLRHRGAESIQRSRSLDANVLPEGTGHYLADELFWGLKEQPAQVLLAVVPRDKMMELTQCSRKDLSKRTQTAESTIDEGQFCKAACEMFGEKQAGCPLAHNWRLPVCVNKKFFAVKCHFFWQLAIMLRKFWRIASWCMKIASQVIWSEWSLMQVNFAIKADDASTQCHAACCCQLHIKSISFDNHPNFGDEIHNNDTKWSVSTHCHEQQWSSTKIHALAWFVHFLFLWMVNLRCAKLSNDNVQNSSCQQQIMLHTDCFHQIDFVSAHLHNKTATVHCWRQTLPFCVCQICQKNKELQKFTTQLFTNANHHWTDFCDVSFDVLVTKSQIMLWHHWVHFVLKKDSIGDITFLWSIFEKMWLSKFCDQQFFQSLVENDIACIKAQHLCLCGFWNPALHNHNNCNAMKWHCTRIATEWNSPLRLHWPNTQSAIHLLPSSPSPQLQRCQQNNFFWACQKPPSTPAPTAQNIPAHQNSSSDLNSCHLSPHVISWQILCHATTTRKHLLCLRKILKVTAPQHFDVMNRTMWRTHLSLFAHFKHFQLSEY